MSVTNPPLGVRRSHEPSGELQRVMFLTALAFCSGSYIASLADRPLTNQPFTTHQNVDWQNDGVVKGLSFVSYAESLRKDMFVAMCRCQDSSVFEVGN